LIRQRVELPPDWIRLGDPEDTRFVRSLSAGCRCDAMVCANDLTADLLMRTIEELHVRVPHELRAAGAST